METDMLVVLFFMNVLILLYLAVQLTTDYTGTKK